jgi:hypothetical protein
MAIKAIKRKRLAEGSKDTMKEILKKALPKDLKVFLKELKIWQKELLEDLKVFLKELKIWQKELLKKNKKG